MDNKILEPCILCNGEIIQERRGYFLCVNCGQSYIYNEKDSRSLTING